MKIVGWFNLSKAILIKFVISFLGANEFNCGFMLQVYDMMLLIVCISRKQYLATCSFKEIEAIF